MRPSLRSRLSEGWMRQASSAVATVLALLPLPARAFESDLHFGLTKWLAIKAGFDESQAEAIGVGNQRVDGGSMDTLDLTLEYACAARLAEPAQQVQRRHYPAAKTLPAAPEQRVVVAGSPAARQALAEVMKQVRGKEGLLLGKLGEALHTLQDSWSHQGTPAAPQPGGGLNCDATLASGHPAARGGPDSHAADLTRLWPREVLAAAAASYEVLSAYPAIQGQVRRPAAWATLVESVNRFSKAATKTDKRDWFVAQAMADTSFLEGISLPDGPRPGPLQWPRRKLPPLPNAVSTQHYTAPDVREFFDQLIARWVGREAIDRWIGRVMTSRQVAAKGKSAATSDPSKEELAARLKLWKLKDHGAAAMLAHHASPLTKAQLQHVERMTRDQKAFIAPVSPADVFFPLLARGAQASPLLPYIVRSLQSATDTPRFIAVARLRHAPYDSVGWIAERQRDRWILVDVVAVVDQ